MSKIKSVISTNQTSSFNRHCIICGSNAIGINFGVMTCAPCKAFFRRNARQKEVLSSPCQHHNVNSLTLANETDNDKTNYYSQIRRCSSCRLLRCFDMGMKEELIRTEEENLRHKELVTTNRQRRELYQRRQAEKQFLIPQRIANNTALLHESEWRHLSNVVSAYETNCSTT